MPIKHEESMTILLNNPVGQILRHKNLFLYEFPMETFTKFTQLTQLNYVTDFPWMFLKLKIIERIILLPYSISNS